MSAESPTTIAVCGATGRQGGAVARCLLGRGVVVRALTRKPEGPPAMALAALGAEVVATDMKIPRRCGEHSLGSTLSTASRTAW